MTIEFKPYPFTAQRHAARVPDLADGVEKRRHAVAIVGGGPVGLTLALGLANHGIACVLIEADDSICFGSRAICISRRSLEIVQRVGALDRFLAIGLPWAGGRSFYRSEEVLHFQMPQDENQKLPPMINLAQYHIEQCLLDVAEQKSELIDYRWQTKVTAIDSHADGARLWLSTACGDYQLDADWVVACDGGRSTIREALGLKLTGTSYEGRYVIVDIELESDRPTERLAYFDPACNPGSTVLVHKQPHNVWRIDYQLPDGEDAEAAIKPENVLPRVQSVLDMMGERGKWAPIWITIYKANALTLERYRHGRALFAGDAAHLVPIFGVRGVNSGIDDADNLAWKLAYVVRGLAGERLLDSYSDERVFATRENLSYGTKSTEFMAPPTFAFALMRRAVLSLAARHPTVRPLINPRQTSAITYIESALNIVDRNKDEFAAGPVPGAVLPECPLTIVNDGTTKEAFITDLLEPCFTAFLFSRTGTISAEFVALAETLQNKHLRLRYVPLTMHLDGSVKGLHGWDHTGRLFETYGAKPGTAYLVRPDGHLLGRWRDARAGDIAAGLEHALHP